MRRHRLRRRRHRRGVRGCAVHDHPRGEITAVEIAVRFLVWRYHLIDLSGFPATSSALLATSNSLPATSSALPAIRTRLFTREMTSIPGFAPAQTQPQVTPQIAATPTPLSPTPTAAPQKLVTIQIPYGTTVLQPGMKLPVISRDAQTARVRYMNEVYVIPVESTELH